MPAEEREYQDAAETSANSVKVLDTALSFIETLMERPQRHAGWRTAFQRLKDSDEAAAAAASDDEDEADGEDADAAGGVAADVVAGSPASSSAAAKAPEAGGGGSGGATGSEEEAEEEASPKVGIPPRRWWVLGSAAPLGRQRWRRRHQQPGRRRRRQRRQQPGAAGGGACPCRRLPAAAGARARGRASLQAVASRRREFAEELANELQRARPSRGASARADERQLGRHRREPCPMARERAARRLRRPTATTRPAPPTTPALAAHPPDGLQSHWSRRARPLTQR